MDETSPLLLVILSILGFWIIGKILTRSYRNVHRQYQSKTRGTKIIEGFHISDLEQELIEPFVALIRAKNEAALTSFIAQYRPKFEEIETYLQAIRQQYHGGFPQGFEFASENDKATAIASMHLVNQPKPFKFSILAQADLRALIEYEPNGKRILTQYFIDKFGGERCIENFRVYEKLRGELPTTVYAQKDHEHRTQLEALVASEMALQGRKIHLRDRLNVLQFAQLKDMAKELKIDKIFKSRAEAADQLVEIPGSAVLLAMIYSVDDIFLLKSDTIDAKAVEREWTVMQAYARLLCRSLDEQALSVLIL